MISGIKSLLKQVLLYTSVGGKATLIDWLVYYVLTFCARVPYLVSAFIAFCISTAANWFFGRLFLFRHAPRTTPLVLEIAKIYLTNAVGLVLNLLLIWLQVEKLGLGKMAAKVIATFIVFFWNFSIRKLVIYKI
mgnify:FL=1